MTGIVTEGDQGTIPFHRAGRLAAARAGERGHVGGLRPQPARPRFRRFFRASPTINRASAAWGRLGRGLLSGGGGGFYGLGGLGSQVQGGISSRRGATGPCRWVRPGGGPWLGANLCRGAAWRAEYLGAAWAEMATKLPIFPTASHYTPEP